MDTQPANRRYLLWIACATASVAVTMAVPLLRHEHMEWLTLAQLVVLLVAAFLLVLRHHRLERVREAAEQQMQELQEARERAESANHSKSRFLASMSHELRAPLNGMLGMLSMLQASKLDPQQCSYMKIAYHSADHLQVLLNDLIDFSAMEDGKMKLHPEPIQLQEMLQAVGDLMRPQAEQKGLTFMVDVDDALSQRLLGDPTRIKQIVLNLLSNAIKFSDRGRVSLLAQPVAPTQEEMTQVQDPSRLHLHIRVIDQGMGMDRTTLSRLFRRLDLADAGTSHHFGSSGLGLEISRNLAQMMGGDISVVSRRQTGSTFTLDLRLPLENPLTPKAAPSHPMAREAGTPGLDIVVAEDHPINRLDVKNMLERMGHGVRFAEDGEKAVLETRRKVPDLVLMDLHMPNVDGFEAARLLRSGHDAASLVPIVALTADSLDSAREQASDAGMEGFLCKPLQLEEIEQLLVRMFGVRGASEQRPADADPATEPLQAATSHALDASPAPTDPPEPIDNIQRHLDMAMIKEICAATNVTGYKVLLDQLMLDESRRLFLLSTLLDAGDAGELVLAAKGMRAHVARLGLTELSRICTQIESTDINTAAAVRLDLNDQLKLAIKTTHALALSMGLVSAPCPALPLAYQTTTGSGSSMMPKRS